LIHAEDSPAKKHIKATGKVKLSFGAAAVLCRTSDEAYRRLNSCDSQKIHEKVNQCLKEKLF